MKKYLNRVTITGASDDTSFADMVEIQKEYPFVEWGILLSRSQKGKQNRFPRQDWLNRLSLFQKENNDFLNLSGHLCGIYVNLFLEEQIKHTLDDQRINELDGLLICQLFKRIQINTHGEKHDVNLKNLFLNVTNNRDVEFIAQIDDVNDYIYELRDLKAQNISGLYDLSHGAGVLPENWKKPLEGIKTGYAGGLSTDNLKEQLDRLENVVSEPTWIDVETWVRTNDLLDLNKVKQFLEISKDRVIV